MLTYMAIILTVNRHVMLQCGNFRYQAGHIFPLLSLKQGVIPKSTRMIGPTPMPLTHLLILALIQGVTEFLPISSSGHLILLPNLSGMQDQGQVIDVAVHLGTLLAVILYFRSDVKMAAFGTLRMLTGRIDTPGSRLAFLLAVATVPVIVAGLILQITGLADAMR